MTFFEWIGVAAMGLAGLIGILLTLAIYSLPKQFPLKSKGCHVLVTGEPIFFNVQRFAFRRIQRNWT